MWYKVVRTNVTTSFTKIFTRGKMEGVTFEILADAEDLLKDSKKRITLSEDPYIDPKTVKFYFYLVNCSCM